MTTNSIREIVDRYFIALAHKDFAAMRPLLHDDVTFRGAMGTTTGAEEYLDGLVQLTADVDRAERQVVVVEGENALQVYDLVFSTPAVTVTIAQWLTVRDDRIAAARVYFDPRPLLPPAAS